MSATSRKKSWEDHVTQWSGAPSCSTEHDAECCHGIAADNLKASMENEFHALVDRKEKCASLPECFPGDDLIGCPVKLLGSVSKVIDENDNPEGEEQFLPLEASTETLVHISGDESELSSLSLQDSLDGSGRSPHGSAPMAQSLLANLLEHHRISDVVCSPAEEHHIDALNKAHDAEVKEEMLVSAGNNSLDLSHGVCFNNETDTPQDEIKKYLIEKEIIAPGNEVLHTAVFAQQLRKRNTLNDVHEHAVYKEEYDHCPTSKFIDNGKPPFSTCRNLPEMLNHGSNRISENTGLEKMGCGQPQMDYFKEIVKKTRKLESLQSVQSNDNRSSNDPAYSHVKLRKRKEAREGRDRSRLDSMVLLIMKLDQLDQDIENALVTSSSPTCTPNFKRRHNHDLESGSESGSDIAPMKQSAKNMLCVTYAGPVTPCPVNDSGAKPKLAIMQGLSEKERKERAEIEAKEACDWLRAAGFPQYAQLYEDLLFPIDIASVKRDHDFLDKDAIEALCRRLNTLNKCAVMKLEISPHRKRSEDSDEDEPCAISGRWTFQRDSKRWSRLEELDVFPLSQDLGTPSSEDSCLTNAASHESVLTDLSEQQEVSSLHSAGSCGSPRPCELSEPGSTRTNSVISISSSGNGVANEDSFSSLPSPKELSNFNFNVKSNERNTKSKTKSLLKRMESLKIKSSHSRKKASSKLGLIISGPVLQEGIDEEKLKQLNCVEISSLNGNHISVPMVRKRSVSNSTQTSSSSSQSETSSAISTPSPVTRTRSLSACNKRVGMYLEGFDPFNQSTFSDVLEQNFKNRETLIEDPVFYIPEDHKPGTFPKALSNGQLSPLDSNDAVSWRTGSFHSQGHLSHLRENTFDRSRGRRHTSCNSGGNRLSIYDNVPGSFLYSSNSDLVDLENEDLFPELDDILYHVKGMQSIVNQWSEKFSDEGDSDSALDSVSPCPSSPKQIHLEADPDRMTPSDLDSTGNSLNETEDHTGLEERRDSGVGASLTRTNRHRLRWHSFQSSHRPSLRSASLQINCQSVAQINLLQKYSLLKLTALLEKYTPSNKHGFSWAVPKFMKRMKVPDYKDRSVFGVPLAVNVRRTGQPLPQSIQQAMRYLRSHCLDQVGLFRKSGVKSRIQALRQMNENSADSVSYEGQSAYDVADMLKQYFRDLPEPVMTSKLSETFLQIYQYVPKDQRLQAIKAAIMLLPDENRDVLQTLLYFLSDVAAAVDENQMTPTNLAVCLAPSLFHLNTLKRENSSPRVMQRKQSLGKPDQKDLNENLAATQGLAHMIAECKKLFQIPEEMSKCRNSYMEHDLRPVSLEELGRQNSDEPSDYRSYLQESIDGLLKEVKEKFKGWVSCSTSEPADLAYKKVCDGPPLRLWKASIEVPAAPEDVLNRILKEQHLWDEDLLDSKVIDTLENQTEIYQYVQNSMAPHPARDYVVLRSWRTNLPKGACALLMTSVDHDRAPIAGVRVNVLMSRYLIESSGMGKSKLTYICRIDLRGHTPEWYHKAFGHFCAAEVVKIRDSFNNPNIENKESKSR